MPVSIGDSLFQTNTKVMVKGGFGRIKYMVHTKIHSVCKANLVVRYQNNTFESSKVMLVPNLNLAIHLR